MSWGVGYRRGYNWHHPAGQPWAAVGVVGQAACWGHGQCPADDAARGVVGAELGQQPRWWLEPLGVVGRERAVAGTLETYHWAGPAGSDSVRGVVGAGAG